METNIAYTVDIYAYMQCSLSSSRAWKLHWEEFDVGHMNKQSEKPVIIRSKEDVSEVCEAIRLQGDKILLWCDGLKIGVGRSQRKRKKALETFSEDDSEDDIILKKRKDLFKNRERIR